MAAGNGFSTSPMGFNKNEVNEYIASISKRLSEIEAEKKEIEKKYESVKKVIDGADDKANKIETAAKEKISQLEEQIKSERKNSEGLIDQVDELKRKLKNALSSAGAAVKASVGSANTAAAEKKSAEIIAAAEKTAKETVARANRTAEEIVEKAKKTADGIMSSTSGANASVDMSGFMAQLRSFVESVNSGCKALSEKAEEISSGKGAVTAEVPDLSSFSAPKADLPETETFESDLDFGGSTTSDSESSGCIDEINALLAGMTDESAGGEDDLNGGMGSDEMDVGFGFGFMDDAAEETKADDSDMSGDALGFDDFDGGFMANDADVPENEESDSTFDLGFGSDMLSGLTDDMASGDGDELVGDLTADLADAVEADDVKQGEDDLDFGTGSEMDEMQKLLAQAELTFGGGSSEFEERTSDVSEEAADDWSSLQNELDALGTQNDVIDDMDSGSGLDSSPANDIWSLGDTDMSESDDDMSSDLFGSF